MGRPGGTLVRGGWLLAVGAALLLTASCGPGPSGPASPGVTPTATSPTAPPPTTDPTAGPTDGSGPSPTGATDLTLVLRDGAGKQTRTTLTCDPDGGTHADPAAACAALADHAEQALPAVRKDQACTQIYGGDATATLTGTWRGTAVRSSFSLKNGCEIARWKMLQGLLPPAGA